MSTTIAANPVAPWTHHRPWRDWNPGDLRPRHTAPPWPGQTAVDSGPGGPFAIFSSRAEGWCALALWLLYAHDVMEWHDDQGVLRVGLKTTTQKIHVFAPPSENDTTDYAAGVAAKVGENADPHDRTVRKALCKAIAHWEDYQTEWPEPEIDSGMMLCDARWPAFLAAASHVMAAPVVAPTPAANDGAATDALNDASLAQAEKQNG